MHDLPITQVRHCLWVADLGNYGLAADKAARSQPAITKSVQALEARLGAALFEPHRRTVLTPFGQACLPYLRELLAHHDRTASTLSALVRKDGGSLTIASIFAVAGNWLPAAVRGFMADFPRVKVKLLDDNSSNVERMVRNHEIDFGLASPLDVGGEVTFEPLWQDGFGLVCSPGHPLAGRASVRWSELKNLPLIGTTVHRQLGGLPEHRYLERPFMHVSTMFTLLSLLREGVGVTVLGRLAVPPRDRNELAFIPLIAPARTRVVGVVRLTHQSPSPAAQEMLRRLRATATIRPEGAGGRRGRVAT